MTDENPNRSTGVHLNDNSSITAQDIIGGDKNTIYNIILVGQFLDQIRIEGLFPKLAPEEISRRVQERLREPTAALSPTDAEAMSFVGEMLAGIVEPFVPTKTSSLFSFRHILYQVPMHLGNKLVKTGHWENALEAVHVEFDIPISDVNVDVVWLFQTQALMQKSGQQPRLFGIARRSQRAFSFIELTPNKKFNSKRVGRFITEDSFTSAEFRVFMVGLIIDLIRIYSDTAIDMQFWNLLVDSITSPKT